MKNFLVTLCLLATVTASAQLTARSIKKTGSNEDIGFYEFKPPNYDPSIKYPMIIFLHGYGERGNGTTQLSRVLNNGLAKNIASGNTMTFTWNGKTESFVVLMPQLNESNYSYWQNWYIDEMLKYGKANFSIDTNRIFLTGLSMGGGGTWVYSALSEANGRKFAAIATSCGACQAIDWCNIAKAELPMWSFHAEDDNSAAPVSCTKGAVSNIRSCPPKVDPYMTIWPTGGHSIWDRVYDVGHTNQYPNVYEWFLGQSRALPVNRRPIANAGPDVTISTTKATVNLSAVYSKDEDGKLVLFLWRKVSGPSAGSLTGAESTTGVAKLQNLTLPGTYVYELKAVDDRADWSTDQVVITVVSGAAPNIPPVTEAGPDQEVIIPEADLNGASSYDPDGTVVSYRWTKIDGPAVYSLSNAGVPSPKISNLLIGDYKFELETTDNLGATTKDTVVVKSTSIVLPIKLKLFAASASGKGTQLNWTTAEETGDEQFIIEASNDGKQYIAVYTTYSKGKIAERNYNWFHANGQSFYRLKIVSGGKPMYSKIIPVRRDLLSNDVEWFPNPVQQTLWVSVNNQERGRLNVRILSMDGRLVKQSQYSKQQDQLLADIDTRDLHTGIYLVAITGENGWREIRKIVKK
ncbi:MAG: T9SS type A sorting domain-containing protein [Chitinophagaceae bacterium]|nr:T9SS type A sorting domain-containing protein [Chitinophagaceae bacterium]